MMTGADRQRPPILFAAVAVLALSGAVLGLLFSPLQAQEGTAPDKPTGLEATATHGQVTLTWDDPNDDTITGYVILRRVRVNDTGGDFDVLVANTNTAALTYTDDTVAAGLTYTYRIKAINEHGVSERSRWFHIDTPAAPVPDKPTGLEATATHDSVTLTWDDPDDDSITGYVILRRVPAVDPQGHFNELVADTGTAATTYTDDTVSAETRYTYRIKAINEHGTSERSRWYHIDTPAAPEPTPAAPQRRSEYIDAHNAGVHDLAELMDGADPLDSDAGDTEEEERVAGKQGKSVGTQQGRNTSQGRSNHEVDICDRTPEIEAGLLAFIVGSGQTVTCSTVTAAQLASVIRLNIDGYSSEEIVASDFAGLTGLTELTISGSRELTTVPANAFSELRSTSIRFLTLHRNTIKTVHRDAFDGLTVGSINLGFNDIEILEPGTFDGVTGLEGLNLSVNHIKAFQDGFFKNLTDLKSLNIASNRIREIDGDMLRGLSSLQWLYLYGNSLASLDADIFDGLTSLQEIHLHRNSLASLDEDLFDGLTGLRSLDLSYNELSGLPADIFDGLTNLEWLFLQENSLASLPADVFDGLTSLEWLYLHGNSLASLDEDLFDGLTSLQRLYLHGNSLASLDEDLFDGLTSLQRLYLHGNSLASLDADIFDGLTSLQRLYLYGNSLASLDEDLFDGLTSLQRLYLHDNSLVSLDADIFDPLDDSLTDLALSDNDFSSNSLPADVFDGLTDLRRLYLHRSGLASLDEDLFDGLTYLQWLYLHGNSLASLDEDLFDGLTSLQRLYLHGNSLASLDEDLFDGLTALQRLYLDGNDLTSLHENLFDGLTDLEDLNLDANMLTALIADVFDGLDDSLTDLYLRDNGLTALPEDIFDGLTGLLRLDLSCNALTTLGLDELDPFAGTLTYLDLGANSFTTSPTEAAVNAKLTAVEAFYLTGDPPCLPAFDTGLSELSLSSGTLTPEFVAPGIPGFFGYRADVGSDVSELTITVAPKDPHASIEPADLAETISIYDDDPSTPGLQVSLDNETKVEWQVRAENGAATQIYGVWVYPEHPPGSVARLRSLELDGLTLTPEFGGTTYGYEAVSPASATQTSVTAIPLDPDATFEYLDSSDAALADADTNTAGHQVDLDVGDTVFKVKVTAEDTTTTQTYTVTVTRAAACALNDGDIWCGVVDVEAYVSGGSTAGHGFLGTTGDIDGNPDDKDFTVPSNSNEYTITSLLVGAGSNSGNLILRLDDVLTGGDQATLELGIDGESDPFLLSTAVAVGGGGGYRWSGTGLDWSMETEVTVRLREEDPPTLSVADATGDEGDDKVVFTVTLSKPYYAATSATWTASIESGDTAVAADLGTTKTGTVSIAATATTATFEVPVADDTTAPSVSSATVSDAGAAIDIVFDEPLDETSTPSTTAFLAGISGIQTDRAVPNNVAVSGDTVTLTIRSGNTIAAGAIVTLAYTAPSTNALADASGNEVESFTGTDAIAVLNRPAAPVVTLTAGDGQLTATWAAPANGGSAITGYDVEWKTAAQTWAEAATAGQSDTAAADATDHEITGLTNNTEYTVRVRAANGAGNGPWSAEASETPAAPDDLPADTTTTGTVEVDGSAVRGDIYKPVFVERTGDDDVDGYEFDTDWFAVELEAGRTYRIDMKGSIPTNELTLRLPQINAIYDADGDYLLNTWGEDESSSHHLFRVTFHAHAGGAYYIAASGESFEWGTYELRVKDITED